MSILIVLCTFFTCILVCELAHGQLINFFGHTGNNICKTPALLQDDTTIYFKFSFSSAKDTAINITMSRDTDTPCNKNPHSLKIYMNESNSNEDLSCSGSYQVSYSYEGLKHILAGPSKIKSTPFVCIDWPIYATKKVTMTGVIEGRFNFSGFDVYYSRDIITSLHSIVDKLQSYHAEIKIVSSKHVKLSQVSYQNMRPDDCEVFLNSSNGTIILKQEDAVLEETVINNKTIEIKCCFNFSNFAENTADVAENALPISWTWLPFFFIVTVVVLLLCLLVDVRSRTCFYVTDHGRVQTSI